MSKPYRLKDRDREVLAAVERLLKRLARSEAIQPAQLVSVAKVLHVLSRLPQVTEDVCVTIELAYRTNYEHSSSSSVWQFSVGSDWLELSCGGSEYTDAVGSDSYTTMTWSAHPGARTDYDGSWDDSWMDRESAEDDGTPSGSSDALHCSITIDDDDNSLLFESAEAGGDGEDAESDPEIEIYRRGEKIELTRNEWRAALGLFEDMGWEPSMALDRYLEPPAFIKNEDGKAMEEGGRQFWIMIDQNAVLAQSLELDLDLFLNLVRFAGHGAFIIGKPGAYEEAKANDFGD